MGTITLDDRDEAVLERLREADADAESLAEHLDLEVSHLRERLPELADNGLVERSDGGRYALTGDGTRALEATGDGSLDDRLDTPPAVEERIRSFGLRPDREAAVRNAFAFLHYWGAASATEIVDAVYAETPAGFDSERAWWDGCVRDRLAVLPAVEPPESDDGAWRYTGTAVVEERADG